MKGKDVITYRFVILSHIQTILSKASKEMRGGYWREQKTMNNAGQLVTTKVYEPDSREEYCNAVFGLYDIIHYELKELRPSIDKVTTKLNEIEVQCKSDLSENQKQVMSDEYYKGNDRVIVENYKMERYKLVRDLLRLMLRSLLKSNYFEGQSYEFTEEY